MIINKDSYSLLGNTDILVSSICFGTLTVSPLQCNYEIKDASRLFCYAIDKGINFFDTARLYHTYAPLKEAIKYKKDIVIASKDYCYDEKTAQNAIDDALTSIGRDYIDIFMLHEQESEHTIRGHWKAIEHIQKRIKQGDIRTAGISTHFVNGVRAATETDEIDIIHPIYNNKSLGIADGNHIDMKEAIVKAIANNKGIYLMKALGGGHLIGDVKKAFDFVREIDGVSSIAIGMKSESEVDFNVAMFCDTEPSNDTKIQIKNSKRELIIHDWCAGCEECMSACQHGALIMKDRKMTVNQEKCIFCGYCASRCKEFCIKVI